MFVLSRATFAEMALAGITVVGEFHYLHHSADGSPYEDPNAMGNAVIRAAHEAGVRLTLLDACYLHGGIEPDPVQRRFFDASAEALSVARHNLGELKNCDFHCASVNNMPIDDSSLDFGYSLGVLHHVPDTTAAIRSCVQKLKMGAPFLVYLY